MHGGQLEEQSRDVFAHHNFCPFSAGPNNNLSLLLLLLARLLRAQKLALIANEVSVIEGLEEQGPTLEQLELYQNHIKRIDNIQHLTHLRFALTFQLPFLLSASVYVNLSRGLSNSASGRFLPLRRCAFLIWKLCCGVCRVLDLSFNNIRRIEHLETLVNLRELFLSSNKITKVRAPPKQGQARERSGARVSNDKAAAIIWGLVALCAFAFAQIEGLSTLKELRTLELGSNRIRVVEGIENLTNLTELWLGRNKITRLVGIWLRVEGIGRI